MVRSETPNCWTVDVLSINTPTVVAGALLEADSCMAPEEFEIEEPPMITRSPSVDDSEMRGRADTSDGWMLRPAVEEPSDPPPLPADVVPARAMAPPPASRVDW